MTQQFSDTVAFRRARYDITAAEGMGLFDPAASGLAPMGWSTGNYRGTVCHYAVSAGRLGLRRLEVGLEGAPPPVAGVYPTREPRYAFIDGPLKVWRYEGLRIPVSFGGKLLIGRGHITGLPFLHMGFEPAWRYAIVWDLAFEDGRLRDARDCSAELAAVRGRLGEAGGRPNNDDGDWVRRTFSLSYAYSWPDVLDQ